MSTRVYVIEQFPETQTHTINQILERLKRVL